jgi:hypothetical protein
MGWCFFSLRVVGGLERWDTRWLGCLLRRALYPMLRRLISCLIEGTWRSRLMIALETYHGASVIYTYHLNTFTQAFNVVKLFLKHPVFWIFICRQADCSIRAVPGVSTPVRLCVNETFDTSGTLHTYENISKAYSGDNERSLLTNSGADSTVPLSPGKHNATHLLRPLFT